MTEPVTYEDLVTAATVGLDRRPLPLEALAGPAAPHAGILDRGDPAAAFLDAAALLFSARRAGIRPSAGPAGTTRAAPDTAPELSPRASAVLATVLRGSNGALLADLLTAAAAAGYRAAAPTLPAMLDAALRDRALRPRACAVLGERGRWLAGLRADWRRVIDGQAAAARPAGDAEDPAVWETGGRAERLVWLAALRDRDPGAARELLASGWAREAGDDREELLPVLRSGLSVADEAFLEAALDDRRAAVRSIAAGLLAAIPESALAARMIERGAAGLRLGRQALRTALIVTLPEAADAAAARDGISAVRPVQAVGARAWLLTQFIAAVPLAEWTARLGLRPAELAGLPVSGGLRLDVHAGWRMAAVAQRDAAWARALLAARENPIDGRPADAWPADAELAAVLPGAEQLAHAEAVLAEHGAGPESVAVLNASPGPWTESLADAVLTELARGGRPGRPRRVSVLLPPAARKLPVTGPRDFAAELRALALDGQAGGELLTLLRRAADIIDLRRLFLRELT